MRYSTDTRRKQKTSNEGWPAKNRMEPEGMQGAPSVSAVSKNRRNGGNECSGNLLERIVDRDNLKAYKRVKANRGSHGVDGMEGRLLKAAPYPNSAKALRGCLPTTIPV